MSFRLLRKYPLMKDRLKTGSCVLTSASSWISLKQGCFGLSTDQLERGKNQVEVKKLLIYAGQVFEDYAASIIKRALSDTQRLGQNNVLSVQMYDQREQMECTDIAVCGDDTPSFSWNAKPRFYLLKTKFSGDFSRISMRVSSLTCYKGRRTAFDRDSDFGTHRHSAKTSGCRDRYSPTEKNLSCFGSF